MNLLEENKHKNIVSPIQDVFVRFLKKLQESNYFFEQPIVVSSVIDEIRNKQPFFETFVVNKLKTFINPHPWLLRDIA